MLTALGNVTGQQACKYECLYFISDIVSPNLIVSFCHTAVYLLL